MLLTLFSFLTRIFHLVLGISTPQSFPPPLPHREEEACFSKMQEGDESARQRLILHNLRLVAHIVRKYYTSARNPEDLVSIGTIGLVKAVDSFHPEKGARFATYASKCIQNEILMHFRSQKKYTAEISINETIDIDRDGNPLTYLDIISVPERIAEEIDMNMHVEKIRKLVCTRLGERERTIIIMRYGLDGARPLTQREVASRLAISRSYVSRIEKKALEALKEAFGGVRPEFDD